MNSGENAVGETGVPVVVTLLAVVLQVGDIVVVSVGVVATPFTPDQSFDVPCCPCGVPAALCLPAGRSLELRCVPLLGPGLAAALHLVHHHHLTDAVRTEVLNELLLILSLEVTRLTVERLLLLLGSLHGSSSYGSLRDGGDIFAFDALLGCFSCGRGARLSAPGQVFSSVLSQLLCVVPYDHSIDVGAWGLGVLDDAELSLVLVVVTVPEQTHR